MIAGKRVAKKLRCLIGRWGDNEPLNQASSNCNSCSCSSALSQKPEIDKAGRENRQRQLKSRTNWQLVQAIAMFLPHE